MSLGAGDPELLSAQAVKRPDNIGTLWGKAIAAPDAGRVKEYRRLMAANRQSIISSDTAFTVPGPDRIPENIAFDSASGTFFLGSLAERTVVRFRPGAPPESFAGPVDGLLRVAGMKVDRPRNCLWVAMWAPVVDSTRLALGFDTDTRLFAFDLTPGRQIVTLVPRDTSRPHLLNDLVITPRGDVYVTDTNEGSVYRVRAGVDTLELAVRPDPARFNYANGIALSADPTRLYVAFAEGIARLGVATQPPQLTGSWTGYWTRAGDTLPVTMVVRRDTTGRHTATFDSERLRVSGVPFAQVSTTGCCDVTFVLRGDRTTAEFKGQLRGDSLTGVFREGTSEGRFAYRRAKPAPPSFDERDITFRNGNVTLAGTLLVPRGQARVPAVVFTHGSGAEGRWASRYLASQFATRGIASLIFDKRGVGGSSGDWRVAGPDDLAADAVAAVARLLDEPRIDAKRIGIHGHSQGGTLAPMVAVRSPYVAFVIASAAAGLPMDSVEVFSLLNSVLPEATTADDSASARQYVGELVSVAYHSRPRVRLDSLVQRFAGRPWFFQPPPADNSYWRFSPVFAMYDPIDWWRRVRVPVLLVYGADDQRVPATASAARIEAALRAGGNGSVTVQMHPRGDHTFRLPPGPSGWPVTAPNYVQGLVGWVAQLH